MTGKQLHLMVCPECLWDGKVKICKSWKTLDDHAETHAPRWRSQHWGKTWEGYFFYFARKDNPTIERYGKTNNLKSLLLALSKCCSDTQELVFVGTCYTSAFKADIPDFYEIYNRLEMAQDSSNNDRGETG